MIRKSLKDIISRVSQILLRMSEPANSAAATSAGDKRKTDVDKFAVGIGYVYLSVR